MSIVDLLEMAGLTGRGGAAFKTAIKLGAAQANDAQLIVNVCDGEIGATLIPGAVATASSPTALLVSGIMAASGPTSGGTTVTISGANFTGTNPAHAHLEYVHCDPATRWPEGVAHPRCDAADVQAAVARVRGGDKDLSNVNLSGADLSGVDLSGARLDGAHLVGANLARANLSSADLSTANVAGANLSGANLRDAMLDEANLTRANLAGASLADVHSVGALFIDANLTGANFTGAGVMVDDFTGANVTGAVFRDVRCNAHTVWPAGFTPPTCPP